MNILSFQDVNPVSKWFLNLVGLEQAEDPVMSCSIADDRKREPLTSDDRYGRLKAVTSARSRNIFEVFLVPQNTSSNSTWRNQVLTQLPSKGGQEDQGSNIRSGKEGQSLIPCTAYTAHCQQLSLYPGIQKGSKY